MIGRLKVGRLKIIRNGRARPHSRLLRWKDLGGESLLFLLYCMGNATSYKEMGIPIMVVFRYSPNLAWSSL